MRPVLHQRGFALLIVLWSLVLLTFLGTQIVARGRGEAQLSGNLRGAAVAEAAADGAVEEAIYHLLDGSSRRWPADGAVHQVRFPRAVVEVRIEDEAGKVNPNFASPALLQSLLARVGADSRTAASVAAAIADWRGQGANPGSQAAGVMQYAAAGRDYGPPGAPFESLDEIGEVLGMTPDLLARLRPHLSLFSQTDPLASTTDPVVAAALRDVGSVARPAGGGRLQVAAITAVAKGPDGARFARRAVIRIGQDAGARPWKILAWTRPEG